MKRVLKFLPRQFIMFGIVGTGGYLVDSAVLETMVRLGIGEYVSQIPAFLVAAGFTWLANRLWTFRRHGGSAPAHRQWARYFIAMLGGFCVNYATYAMLLTLGGLWQRHLPLAVAAGSIAGLAFNFPASKYFVFRPPASEHSEGYASSQDR